MIPYIICNTSYAYDLWHEQVLSLSLSRHLQIAFATEAQVEFSEETAEIACGWPQ